MESMATAYSLEVSMYHIARMKVAEALSDVGQLVAPVSVGLTRRAEHRPVQFGLHWHVS